MILLDLFFGLVALLMVYQLYCFLRYRGSDYLYFLFFILSVALFIGILAGTGSDLFPLLQQATPRYALGFGVLLIGSAMYYRFIRFFCDTDHGYPVFNRISKWMEYIQLIAGVLLIAEVLIYKKPVIMKLASQGIYILSALFQVYMAVFLFSTRKSYKIILAIGGIIMGVLIKWVLVPVALRAQNINDIRIFTYVLLGVLVNFCFIVFAFYLRSRKMATA